MRTNFRSRLRLISICLIVFALVLVSKLYFVQVVSGEEFSLRADRQYLKQGAEVFDRGSIFFETKDKKLVSAATLRSGFIVAINPEIIDADSAYLQISEIVPIDREAFFLKSGKKGDPYEEVARQVPDIDALRIEALKIPGVNIYRERWRFYPGEKMAAQTVGFIGWSDKRVEGLYGLERYYEDTLARNSGDVYVNFFAEIFSNIGKSLGEDKVKREGDIITTIEPSVEIYLEKKLEEVAAKWGATEVGGIVMDPNTGEINAMAIYPTFDLNNFKNTETRIFSNPIVENVYEMGSIIKPLTIAAGLDSGAITAETTYNDLGYLIIDGARISNFDLKGRGVVSMQEVLNQSLNTGVSFAVKRMGKDVFADYFRKFGIGEETGIDLPNETGGLVSNLESPREIEYATASFGQGIALTPIETVRALATLGNGGRLVNPHLARKINFKSGLSKTIYDEEPKQVLKKETSEEITRMLVKVVDEALLGGTVKLPNHTIAAKTGTAQIPNKQGGYYEDRYLHSFFGYFPAYKPEFIIFLYALNPQAKYASETLTHPFIDTAKFLINYYEIPPDR